MWKKILIFLGIISVVIFTTFASLIIITASQIKKGDYSKASQTAKIASVIIDPISKITFEKSSNIELLKYSLHLVSDFPKYESNLTTASDPSSNDNFILDIKNLSNTLQSLNNKIQIINKLANQSSIAKSLIKKNYLSKLNDLSTNLPDFTKIAENLSSKNQKIIVVFQNSDELRATGGFMGSYAIVNIENGKITEIVIEDIYDADGQFDGFIEAPSGVKEYLSDDKGLRLSNANWHPDFPTSAKQILQFFALGNKSGVTTIVAINPDYAKLILNITGDIRLDDYGATITSDNISEILRSKRSAFFPGSKQKKHLLSQLLTQLQIRFSNISESSKFEIFKHTLGQLEANNIQLYSIDSEIDEIFSKNKFRQELEYQNDSDYLFLVESNVGINKANKNIIREVDVKIGGADRLITINFKNNNLSGQNRQVNPPTNYLGYINYQRIIVKPSWELSTIKQNGEAILSWNEIIIENSSGHEFKEIGFITTLKEQEVSTLEIEFKNSQQSEVSKNTPYKIYVQKQPGLPPTPYTVKKEQRVSQTLLENDFLFEL